MEKTTAVVIIVVVATVTAGSVLIIRPTTSTKPTGTTFSLEYVSTENRYGYTCYVYKVYTQFPILLREKQEIESALLARPEIPKGTENVELIFDWDPSDPTNCPSRSYGYVTVVLAPITRITPPVMADLNVENCQVGQPAGAYIVITYLAGDILDNAFTVTPPGLANLEIRVGGMAPTGNVVLNGISPPNKTAFEPGDVLQVPLPTDLDFVISIRWKPTGQTLRYIRVC